MPSTAISITNGNLGDDHGKTAHGLIRGSERFKLIAVLDPAYEGRDAGEVIDGVHRNIPVFGSLEQLLKNCDSRPECAIIGVALEGGKLPESWKPLLMEVVSQGISLVAGLHIQLSSYPELVMAAQNAGVELIDIRKPRPIEELSFFSGEIYNIEVPRIAVLGTDCAVGKRTTTRALTQALNGRGLRAEMIYTGQTGWMQGAAYGIILDCLPNDYVSGELERVIVECAKERKPELILLEGQSSLRNPFGPCGSELLLSGNAKHVILQHAPFRTYIENVQRPECRIPHARDEIELISLYGSETIAVCLNGMGSHQDELTAHQKELQDELNIPVIRPLEEGLERLLPQIRSIVG